VRARTRRHHPLVAALPLRTRFYRSGLYISPIAPLMLGFFVGILTILLGCLFSYVQFGIEYAEAGFAFGNVGDETKANLYGSTFFMATGFHGFHVVIGTIFLAVCLYRAYLNHFTPRQHLGFEFAAWYWHFVDVVWLFLFAFVYVTPRLALGG
jgi:cytochrome c oxidase subunit 3